MDWTKDRIKLLTKQEIGQLRANAERLRETEIVGLCDEVLGERRKGRPRKRPAPADREARAGVPGHAGQEK